VHLQTISGSYLHCFLVNATTSALHCALGMVMHLAIISHGPALSWVDCFFDGKNSRSGAFFLLFTNG
jgi:hypothetical protein